MRQAAFYWRAARSSPAEITGEAAAARGRKGLLEILSTDMEMTFWLPETEAALSHVE